MKKIALALFASTFLAVPAQALTVVEGSGEISNTDPLQMLRLNRDGVASTFAAPKAFPGTFGSGEYAFDAFSVDFASNAFQDVFYRITYTNDDGFEPHGSAYANFFNPLDLSENYLGDSGSSPDAGDSATFEVIVPTGQQLVLQFNENFQGGLATPLGYSYTVEAFSDAMGGQIFAVPEPATWAFMIFGFGAIGGAMRRQRKANVKVSFA